MAAIASTSRQEERPPPLISDNYLQFADPKLEEAFRNEWFCFRQNSDAAWSLGVCAIITMFQLAIVRPHDLGVYEWRYFLVGSRWVGGGTLLSGVDIVHTTRVAGLTKQHSQKQHTHNSSLYFAMGSKAFILPFALCCSSDRYGMWVWCVWVWCVGWQQVGGILFVWDGNKWVAYCLCGMAASGWHTVCVGWQQVGGILFVWDGSKVVAYCLCGMAARWWDAYCLCGMAASRWDAYCLCVGNTRVWGAYWLCVGNTRVWGAYCLCVGNKWVGCICIEYCY